jgi:hypothetical protein
MREDPLAEPQKKVSASAPEALEKWMAEVCLTAFSEREFDRLENDLAGSAEKRQVFIENRIFSQCLREVFRRQSSPGLAVLSQNEGPMLPPDDLDRRPKSGGITVLGDQKRGLLVAPGGNRKLKWWRAAAISGLLGIVAGYSVSEWGRIRKASVTLQAAGLNSSAPNSAIPTLVKLEIRGEVLWVHGERPAFSMGEGSLEIETSPEAAAWRVQTARGNLEVKSGGAWLEIHSGKELRIQLHRGEAAWIGKGGAVVELTPGAEYREPSE